MNVIEQATVFSPTGKEEICAKVIVDDVTVPYVFHGIASAGELYTLSFHVRSESTGSVSVAADVFETERNWKYCVSEFTSNAVDLKLYFELPGTYYLYKTQLEIGNKTTDWRPSTDDIETSASKAYTIAVQTADKFNWLVASGDNATEFTLTERMATLIAETISLNGNVKVNGDMIIDGTIGANKFNVESLESISAKIGGYEIGEYILKGFNVELYAGHSGAGSYIKFLGARVSLQDNLTIDAKGLDTYAWSLKTEQYSEIYYPSGDPSTSVGVNANGTYGVFKLGKYLGYPANTLDTKITLNGFNGTIISAGDITVDKSAGTDTARFVLKNSLREARLFISSSGDIGLYDATNNKYLFTAPANASQLNISLPIQTGGKLAVGGSVYTTKGNGLFCDNQAIARISDVTNYTNCVQLGNSSENYVVSIYSNGNVWKSGSKTTYFSTTSSSDKRLKNHVRDMDAYEEFFMNLKPVAFTYHDGLYNIKGTQPMIQWGFYAQDTIEAFKKSGLDWKKEEFVVVEDGELSEAELKYVKDGALLKMNYQNISALNTHMTQKNCNDIEELKNKINELENKISALMASV